MNWINIKDELPKIEDKYLILCLHKNRTQVFLAKFNTEKNKFFPTNPKINKRYITHWASIKEISKLSSFIKNHFISC